MQILFIIIYRGSPNINYLSIQDVILIPPFSYEFVQGSHNIYGLCIGLYIGVY